MHPTTDNADFSLTIRPATAGGGVTVGVGGDLDLTCADELQRVVQEELDRAPVLLDLSRVTFIDSSGLRALDALARHSRDVGGGLRIDPNLPDSVVQILELTGMMGILPFER